MAKGLINSGTLEDIADAIREKNGSSETYLPSEMPNAISHISTTKTIEKTINPQKYRQEFRPSDEGDYNGYSKVTVNAVDSNVDSSIQPGNIKQGVTILGVNGSVVESNETSVNITPTTNYQTITPETGYTGFGTVTVNAVTREIDDNIQANNIRQGVSILGVNGTLNVDLQDSKTVTPTREIQRVTPDTGYSGLEQVVVNSIPSEYIIPSGQQLIISNGSHNVRTLERVKVEVTPRLQSKSQTITQNGTINITPDRGYEALRDVEITTDITPSLETKSVTITQNGTTTISKSADKDGMTSVDVTVNVDVGGVKYLVYNNAWVLEE